MSICCKKHQNARQFPGLDDGTVLAIVMAGGCLMRSLAIQRYSTAVAIAALAVTMAQALTLNLVFPVQQIQLAWTLTRVLLQL
jgi:hypothetical protein